MVVQLQKILIVLQNDLINKKTILNNVLNIRIIHCSLRVQNEQFSEEKGFILRYTEKEVGLQFPPGFEPPIHGLRSERSTTELSDLLMNGHKNSVYQVHSKLFTIYSGIRNCHKMTNCEQFRTKCCVKISATLTLASTHVFLSKMCQECYNRRES